VLPAAAVTLTPNFPQGLGLANRGVLLESNPQLAMIALCFEAGYLAKQNI
jgi:hypothetical protein